MAQFVALILLVICLTFSKDEGMLKSHAFRQGILIFISFFPLLAFSFPAIDEISLLRQLVNLNSGSENVNGVNQVQKIVERELKQLGFQTEWKNSSLSERHTARLLIGTLPGSDPRFVTLVTHSDTVFEPSAHFDGMVIDATKQMAHGPGVADDKGGVVVALSGLNRYLKDHHSRYSLRIVVSPSEETGTEGFLSEFKKYSLDSIVVLGFEPSIDGAIIDSRRGNRWYQIKVVGKEAHGSERAGINACHELALKLVLLERLASPEKNITVSIGHMEGGKDKFNIVCGEATAKVDTRFPDAERSEELKQKIAEILSLPRVKSAEGGEVPVTSFKIADESPAFPANPISRPFVQEYGRILSELEKQTVEGRLSIGSADTNYFYRDGLVIVDGLGPIGEHEHTNREVVSLASLRTRSIALSRFLLYLEKHEMGSTGK